MSEVKKSIIKLSPTKLLKIQPVDGKRLYINTSSVAFLNINKDEDGRIESISLEDKYIIKKGDKFSINIGALESVYEVKYMIVEKNKKSILLFSSIPTKTSTFLLPLLRKTKKQLKYDSYFVNAFIDDKSEYISLLYRFTGTEMYKKFEQIMMSDSLFVTHKEYDNYHVLYVFKIPEEFKLDVESLKKGKYSLFSKALRHRIMKFYGEEEGSAVIQIIRKDEKLKKKIEEHLEMKLPEAAEFASKPDLNIEIYNIN